MRHALLPCLAADCQHALPPWNALLTSAWPVTPCPWAPGSSSCVTCLPGHSNAGVLAALSLLGATLFWPSLMALPYEVLVLYHTLLWARHKRPGQIAPARALQAYTGKAQIAFKYVYKPVRHCRGPVHISSWPLWIWRCLNGGSFLDFLESPSSAIGRAWQHLQEQKHTEQIKVQCLP